MKEQQYLFIYEEYDTDDELTGEDVLLLNNARRVTANAYAPYSNFLVGAAARLVNNEIVTGCNQENASFPVSICAERVLLSTAASLYPNVAITAMAISYNNLNGENGHPVSPCGVCRQSLQEYEGRANRPLKIIMAGFSGKIIIISSASMLLPLSFTATAFAKHTTHKKVE